MINTSQWVLWLNHHEGLVSFFIFGSGLVFIATLFIVPIFIVSIPSDYFVRIQNEAGHGTKHPMGFYVFTITRNVLGALFVLMGIFMLVLPGQGLVTLFVGIMLIDFPKKRLFLLWMIRKRSIYKSLNWARKCAHRAPLMLKSEP